jgi:hypothetical protein
MQISQNSVLTLIYSIWIQFNTKYFPELQHFYTATQPQILIGEREWEIYEWFLKIKCLLKLTLKSDLSVICFLIGYAFTSKSAEFPTASCFIHLNIDSGSLLIHFALKMEIARLSETSENQSIAA